MENKYFVVREYDSTGYATYEDAERQAKLMTNDRDWSPCNWLVVKAEAMVRRPTPDAEVVKL